MCQTLCDPMDYTVHGILQAKIQEWVAFLFSRRSSQPRDQTQVSHIAGGFFTSWATREAQECWSGLPFLSPGDLPNPGIKSRSPTPQADSLPPEPRGKPFSRVCVTSYKEPKTSAEKHPLANGRILESTCGHQRHVSLQKTSSFLLRNHHF